MNQRGSFFLPVSKLSGGNGVRWIRELTMTRRAGQINCTVSNLHDGRNLSVQRTPPRKNQVLNKRLNRFGLE